MHITRTLVIAAGAMVLASAASATTLKMWGGHAADYPTSVGQLYFGEKVKELTNGKYEFKFYPSMTLGSENSGLDQVRFGAIDAGNFNIGPTSDTVEEYKLLALPYVFSSEEQMYKVLDGEIGDELAAKAEKNGLVVLGWYGSGARSFYNSKHPIKTPADLEGMKVRVQQTAVFVDTIEALGAKATPLPFGEVYTALKTGVVDGAENNWPSYESTAHYEVAKYYSLDRHSIVPEILCVSKKLWGKLSDDEKKAFQQAATESEAVMRKAWDVRVEKSKKIVIDAGTEVNEVDVEAFQAKMKPVYDKYLTPEAQALLDRIRAVK